MFIDMELIKGTPYQAQFSIMDDSGLYAKDLSNATSSTFKLYKIETGALVVTYSLTIDLIGDIDYVVLDISTAELALLESVQEGKDDQYRFRTSYRGVLTVNYSNEAPTNAEVDAVIVKG